jgi:hypothetical protein
MLGGTNIGLICTRQTKDAWGVLVTRDVCGHKTCGAYDINYLFPLNLQPDADGLQLDGHAVRSNLSRSGLGQLFQGLRRRAEFTDAMVFNYMYGVFHSPAYRERYREFLRTDFPRVPTPRNPECFEECSAIGAELVALHLLESSRLEDGSVAYLGQARPSVGRVAWSGGVVWLDSGSMKKSGGGPAAPRFEGVSREVWEFHVGGYQVCEKWLKDRKGRTLSGAEIAHYQKITVAIRETLRLMKAIDDTVERYGGWPSAFLVEGELLENVTAKLPLVAESAASGTWGQEEHQSGPKNGARAKPRVKRSARP